MCGSNPSTPLRGVRLEALASRKACPVFLSGLVHREVRSEGSETAKLGTDPSTGSGQAKQKVHKRHGIRGE